MKTGYQVFSSELWNKVKAERGYDSFTDIIREIAQMVSEPTLKQTSRQP